MIPEIRSIIPWSRPHTRFIASACIAVIGSMTLFWCWTGISLAQRRAVAQQFFCTDGDDRGTQLLVVWHFGQITYCGSRDG